MIGKLLPIPFLSIFLIAVSACSTQPYHYESTRSLPIRARAVTQSQGTISVLASVPGKDEAAAIFGIPVYKRGIQPVWLEIVNNSTQRLRFAPTALDPRYFSPLEVSYIYRKGFTKQARSQMDQRFYDSAMPRQIPAGETRSGYVFTHVNPGTKSFNIDLFGVDADYSFVFFVTVPGFIPDHAEIDFETLYKPEEIHNYKLAEFRDGLAELPFRTTDQSEQRSGLPIGSVIVGEGVDVLKALLRAGWYESYRIHDGKQLAKGHYLFGRTPDAVFRIRRSAKKDRNRLYLWAAPSRVDGKPVWLAQVTHFIGRRTQQEQVIFGERIDPNIDDGRDYLMQNLWYSQSLGQWAWLARSDAISIENAQLDFNGFEYFTDGYINVIWLSGKPISLLETRSLSWDNPPFMQ